MNLRLFILFLAFGMLAPLCEGQGISLSLRLEPGEALIGQPVIATFTLRNDGEEKLRIPDGLHPASPFFRIEIYDADSRSVQNIGEQGSWVLAKKLAVPFRPGEEWSWTAKLTKQFALVKAGDYKIAGVYEISEKQCRPCAAAIAEGMWYGRVDVESSFTLREPSGIDKEAYDYLFSKHKAAHVKAVNDSNAKNNGKRQPPSDEKIRAEVGMLFYRDTIDLLEKYPSSLYTAYAIWQRQKPNFRPIRDKVPATPEQIIESLVRNSRNPVGEYSRSVRPGKRAEESANWHLIIKHHPDFVFIDEVYEALGLLYTEDLKPSEARVMFKKAAEVTKNEERKARMRTFISALGCPEKKMEAE